MDLFYTPIATIFTFAPPLFAIFLPQHLPHSNPRFLNLSTAANTSSVGSGLGVVAGSHELLWGILHSSYLL